MSRRSLMLAVTMLLVAGVWGSALAQGELVEDQITSPSLEGNPLGDPATRNISVYLPPSYDNGGRFPVIYLLHGFTGNARTFISNVVTGLYWPPEADFPEGGLPPMLDEMMAVSEPEKKASNIKHKSTITMRRVINWTAFRSRFA